MKHIVTRDNERRQNRAPELTDLLPPVTQRNCQPTSTLTKLANLSANQSISHTFTQLVSQSSRQSVSQSPLSANQSLLPANQSLQSVNQSAGRITQLSQSFLTVTQSNSQPSSHQQWAGVAYGVCPQVLVLLLVPRWTPAGHREVVLVPAAS